MNFVYGHVKSPYFGLLSLMLLVECSLLTIKIVFKLINRLIFLINFLPEICNVCLML